MAKRDCSELAQQISDDIMFIAAEPGVKNLDDAIARYKKLVPGMTTQMVIDSVIEATEGTTGDPDSLAAKINAIKREARGRGKLADDIAELEAYIKAGAIPATKTRKQQAPPEAIKVLRDVRDGLKKTLRDSDPVRRARVQAQIDDLTKRLKSGDIYPKPKAKLPMSKELETLEFQRDEIRKEIRNEINDLKPKSLFQKVGGFFDISRDVTLSFDLGAVLRQGGFFLASKPIASKDAFKDMVIATKSEQGLAKVDKAIAAHPDFMLFKKAGGFIAPTDGTHKPSQREEAHRSSWAEKYIPGVRMSNRAYVSFLNKMRIDVFSTLTKALGKNNEVTFEEAQALARFVNIATGRGELGKFSNIAEGLAIPFLAPRYVLSRFQLLGGAVTSTAKGVGGSRVHRLIAKEYGKYMIGISLIAALLSMIATIYDKDLTIEKNPLSTDFGKAKLGNTRVDLLSGVGSVTTILSRVIAGRVKSTTSGEIIPIRGEDKSFMTGGIPSTIGKFLRYKLSPLLKFPLDALSGENAVGEPVTTKSLLIDFVTPLAFKDIKDSIEDQGLGVGAAVSLAAILGAATNTYGYGVKIKRLSNAELNAELEKSVYKMTTRSKNTKTGEIIIRVKGQPHKNKEFKVKALNAEIERRRGKATRRPQSNASNKNNELGKIFDKLGIDLG